MGFFCEREKRRGADFGENETCVPRALGLTRRSVTRGGFMNGVQLTFMMFSNEMRSSTPPRRTSK